MNQIPIFPLLAQSDEVRSLISNDDGTLRAFKFGFAGDEVQMPYVVWRNITGSAFNNINDRPSGDQIIVQIDVYDTDPDIVDQLAQAVRYAIELNCSVSSYRDIDQDPDDKSYHIGFDVIWVLIR